jgi:hypothetical protein
MIKVLLKDKEIDLVDEFLLEDLIESNEIIGFCRAEGWVFIDKDPIRDLVIAQPERERRKGVPVSNSNR